MIGPISPPAGHPPPRRRRAWWALASGYAACAWAILFAFANIYLQLGGPDPLQGGMSHSFRGGIMLLNLAVIPIKLLAALVALALVQPWGERLSPRLRRSVLVAAGCGCAILVGYPAMGMLVTVAVQTGLLAAPPAGILVGGGFQPRVLLYGTFFLIPGLLYGIAARDYARATRGMNEERSARPR